MEFSDYRSQLLSNIHFLYGPEASIVTLNHLSGYQAIVTKYDNSTKTWSKLLHSGFGVTYSRENAMEGLLSVSEWEIAKRWASTGVEVPFRGEQAAVEMCSQRLLIEGGEVDGRESNADSDPSGLDLLDTPQDSVNGKYEDIQGVVIHGLDEDLVDVRDCVGMEEVIEEREQEEVRHYGLQVDEPFSMENEKVKDEPIHEPIVSNYYIAEVKAKLFCEPVAVERRAKETKETNVKNTHDSYEGATPISSNPWEFWGVPRKPTYDFSTASKEEPKRTISGDIVKSPTVFEAKVEEEFEVDSNLPVMNKEETAN